MHIQGQLRVRDTYRTGAEAPIASKAGLKLTSCLCPMGGITGVCRLSQLSLGSLSKPMLTGHNIGHSKSVSKAVCISEISNSASQLSIPSLPLCTVSNPGVSIKR